MSDESPKFEKVELSDRGNLEKEKLPPLVMMACGWPIVIVVMGGLIGGLLGGAACGVNMALYKSKLPRWSLWILNPLVGVTAFVLYLVLALALGLALAE